MSVDANLDAKDDPVAVAVAVASERGMFSYCIPDPRVDPDEWYATD